MTAPLLPSGLTARALRHDPHRPDDPERSDARAVYDLVAAQETEDVGRPEIEFADVLGDWARPSFDVGSSTIGVLEDGPDGERLIGYAEVGLHGRGEASVDPAHRGRGIGRWLAAWMCRAAAERGWTVIGTPVPAGSPGDRLLERLGWRVRWTSWVLALGADDVVASRSLPEDYEVREAVADEYRDVHHVIETAFSDWSAREIEPYEDFAARTYGRPDSAPWNIRVARGPDGVVVGAAVVRLAELGDGAPEAHVSAIGVLHDHRGQGLAQALLADAFATARGRGAAVCGLSTDSRTGALGLYEKVGMRVTSTWVNRAADLTDVLLVSEGGLEPPRPNTGTSTSS